MKPSKDYEQKELDFLSGKSKNRPIKDEHGVEIERTYLCKDENAVKVNGKLSHHTISYIYNINGTDVRLVDKYVNLKDAHTYKSVVKSGSGMKRTESNSSMTEKEFKDFQQKNADKLIGEAHNDIYFMWDGSVVLVRHYPNGKTISTGEKEYDSEAAAQEFKLPPWAVKEVTDDPKYRGNKMAIDNFRK